MNFLWIFMIAVSFAFTLLRATICERVFFDSCRTTTASNYNEGDFPRVSPWQKILFLFSQICHAEIPYREICHGNNREAENLRFRHSFTKTQSCREVQRAEEQVLDMVSYNDEFANARRGRMSTCMKWVGCL